MRTEVACPGLLDNAVVRRLWKHIACRFGLHLFDAVRWIGRTSLHCDARGYTCLLAETQRCNNCMAVFDEQLTECPVCKHDDALMYPYEDVAKSKPARRKCVLLEASEPLPPLRDWLYAYIIFRFAGPQASPCTSGAL